MYPVLLSVGPLTLTSFGVFLILSVILSSFAIWRLARLFDQNEERVFDLIVLTFLGALIGSRLYFVISHLAQFKSVGEMILFIKHPGFAFWGGLAGGILAFFLVCRFFKLKFWVMADYCMVGLALGLAIGSFGCLLSSCQSGLPSDLPIAITQTGLIGKRFPIQLIETGSFLLLFIYLWNRALKFHFTGKIALSGLIVIGVIKLVLEFGRADPQIIVGDLSLGGLYSLALIIVGARLYYLIGKRSFKKDWRSLMQLFLNRSVRQDAISKLQKRWYNFSINTRFVLRKKSRTLFKRINVKSTPTKF